MIWTSPCPWGTLGRVGSCLLQGSQHEHRLVKSREQHKLLVPGSLLGSVPCEMPPHSSALGIGQVLSPASSTLSLLLSRHREGLESAQRGFGNNIPDNFTVTFFLSLCHLPPNLPNNLAVSQYYLWRELKFSFNLW